MIAGRIASSVAQRQVKYLSVVAAGSATGRLARIYEQVADEMRIVIPPALLHSPAPDVLAAFWALMREPLIAGVAVDRGAKETVAAAISVANICPYCADMHSVSLYDLSTEDNAEAVVSDRVERVADSRLRAVATWARSAHLDEGPSLLPAGLSVPARAELVGVAVSMHYLTRMVNVFLPNFLLPPGLGPRSRRRLKQGLSLLLRPVLRERHTPGRSLPLLPTMKRVPAAPAWVGPNLDLAAAVSRSYAVFERAGRRSLSPEVRQVVSDRLAAWRGEETGLSTAWCEALLVGLSDADRAAGRLALLTALASYQVDEAVVAEFRTHYPDDRALIEATAWASYSAAALIGRRHHAAVASASAAITQAGTSAA